MALEELVTAGTTRRRFVGTGAKLAYTAPLIAASFKMSAQAAGAVVVSGVGGCTTFNCGSPEFCSDDYFCDSFGRYSCICSHSVDGVPFCGDWCFACGGGTGFGCDADSDCASGWHCTTTCCGNYCVGPCGVEGPVADVVGADEVAADPAG